MSRDDTYGSARLWALVALRWVIGWHLMYEGIAKLTNPYWSAAGFLSGSQGPLSGWYLWLASDATRLSWVDALNAWGLTATGAALLLGLYAGPAIVAAIVLLVLYYLGDPPWPGMEPLLPSEGSYLFVNKTLVEIAALFVLLQFPTSRRVGLDALLRAKGEAR